MTRLSIIGAGGHGKVVAEVAQGCGYVDITFLDQKWPEKKTNGAWQVVGVSPAADDLLFCAVGNNATRRLLSIASSPMPILIHPAAVISSSVTVAAGSVAMAGAIVNAGAKIGQGAILNTGCSIDHDSILGDFVHVSPGARLGGDVRVGDGTWIGIGAVVCEGVTIGANVVIAAGAAVVNDVADNTRVGGVPALTF